MFQKILKRIYAGTVITLFEYTVTPTHGNWFQTNQPEHESDDRAGNQAGISMRKK